MEAAVTDTDRMAVWLRETLDAAERVAEAAARETTSADWEYQHHDNRLVATIPPRFTVADVDYLDPAPGKFMADNDPAAVLRRIAADRKTLAEHKLTGADFDGTRMCLACGGYNMNSGWGAVGYRTVWPCPTIRNLAEGYGWKDDQ